MVPTPGALLVAEPMQPIQPGLQKKPVNPRQEPGQTLSTHTRKESFHQRGRVVAALGSLVALIAFLPGTIAAQEAVQIGRATERRARNRPLLRLRSEIPTAPTIQLRFVSDQTGTPWLYSGGLDKVVRRWKLVADGESSNRRTPGSGSARFEFDCSFKWPVYRGIRGRINAIDVFADTRGGQRLAIGGFGSKSSMISLLSADDPTSTQTLFDLGTAARQVIWSLAFDPTGGFVIAGEGKRPGNAPANIALWQVGHTTSHLSGGGLQVSCAASDLREVRHVAVNPTGTHVAAAGPAMNGSEFLIEIWKLKSLASALRDPGRSLVQKVDPIRTVRIRSRWDRTIRGLAWSDHDTWVAATILGPVSGDTGNVTDLAGFEGVQPGMFEPGVRLVKSADLEFPEVQNHRSSELNYWYAPQTKGDQAVFEWTKNQRLQPGRRAEIRDQRAVAFQRLRDGVPYGRRSTIPAKYRLEFWEYVTAVAAVPNGPIALGIWDEGRGRVVLRDSIDDVGKPLPDSTFHEVYCVALSPDGRYVAAAGIADVVSGSERNRAAHTVYQIRVWSTATRELLAQVPDDRTGDDRPPVGGPIANVAIFPDEAGKPAIRFAFGHVPFDDRTAAKTEMTNEFLLHYLFGGIQQIKPASAAEFRGEHAIVRSGETKAQGRNVSPQQVTQGRPFQVRGKQQSWLKIKLKNANGKTVTRWLDSKDVQVTRSWPRLWWAVSPATRLGTFQTERRLGGQFNLTVSLWTMEDGEGRQVGPFPVIPGNEPTCGVRFEQDGRDLVALGLLDGVQIWDVDRLNAGDGRKAILRNFYGHDSKVTCLDVSPDGRWLASGSDDGTICGWSLLNLGGGNELGVSFNRSLRVTAVAAGSPGWEAGFEAGQVVQSLQVAGRSVNGSQSILQSLTDPVPGEELLVTVNRSGKEIELMTPVSMDPLWTFYPYHDRYWLMWTPAGYFDSKASIGLGDVEARFEWHVNPSNVVQSYGRQPGVVTMRAIDFEREFRSTEILERVATTLTPAANNLPLVPAIDLRLDRGTARLSIEPAGADQTVVERSLWLNGKRLRRENPVTGNAPLQVKLPQEALRSGRNTVTSIVTIAQRTAGNVHRCSFQTTRVFDHSAQDRPQPRLHYVGIGVTKLESELGLQPLASPANDVIEVRNSLQRAAGQLAVSAGPAELELGAFDDGSFRVLADTEDADQPPTKENLLTALSQLARTAQPDDLAVIMLAGHGVMRGQNGQSTDFHFAARDALISRSELTDRLVELPCRSLLVLDTCHSGAANAANIDSQVEGLVKLMVGPHILTACGKDEQSEEAPGYNHGVFTLALLEGIDGECRVDGTPPRTRDDNEDAVVTVEELCRFVQDRTPDLIKSLQIDDAAQHPQILRSRSFEETQLYPAGTR